MKRMERLERAVGQLQSAFAEFNTYFPDRELDLREKYFQPDNNAMMGDESGVFHLPPVAANGEEAEL